MNTTSTTDSTPRALSPWVDSLFTRLERIQRPGVLLAVVAQLLVLGGMIGMQMIPHLSGTTVWLKVVPVDPRDMFKGDYVILSYRMSQSSNAAGWVSSDDVPAGTPVYVTLVPDDDGIHHRADQYLPEPPPSGLYIKGTRQGWNRIEYGIESFYVQAGTGLDYEEAARTGTLSAEVAIGGDGQAGLKRLQVNKR